MAFALSLTGKTALVTGASRGIGQAIALSLGQAGARVIGTATTAEGAQAISATLEKSGITGFGIAMNVAEPESVAVAFQEIDSRAAMPEILINNAGITRDNLLLRMKDAEWQSVIDTNLTGIFSVTRQCIKHMMKTRFGRIISVSSLAGVAGNPGQCNYAATKAAVIGFSKSLALEVASRNITVNVIAPGLIATDMANKLTPAQQEQMLARVPLQRLGLPEEIAALTCFLASDAAAYITGETININGGMYLA